MFERSSDEELTQFYYHKIQTNISFLDFKKDLANQVKASKMTDEEVNEVMEWSFQYITPKVKEVR